MRPLTERSGLIACPGCEDEAYKLKFVAIDLNAMQDGACCDRELIHAAGSL